MSKWTVFCLGACVLAAVSLVSAVGSSSADERYFDYFDEERYFRVVDGELVGFDPWQEPNTHHFVHTESGDIIEIDVSAPPGAEGSLEVIAEAVGGMDQLVFRDGEVLYFHIVDGWLAIDRRSTTVTVRVSPACTMEKVQNWRCSSDTVATCHRWAGISTASWMRR